MIARVVEGAWLFVRGSASVRISRRAQVDGGYQLVVHGPGAELSEHQCPDLVSCVDEQMRVERRLMAEGFMLDLIADRRRTHRVVKMPDRRGRVPVSGRT